jgi:hypothetical protein
VTAGVARPNRRPNVLFVAVHYPPEQSGGVPRAMILEDFLVRSGCRVQVLTPQPAATGCRGGEVLRVPHPWYLAKFSALGSPQAGPRPGTRGGLLGLLKRLSKQWLFVPDVLVEWSLRAARAAAEAHRREPFDLVITSSPPESAHWVGWILKRRFHIPWLADFRDGWTFEPLRPEVAGPIRGRIEAALERRVLGAADWATAATLPLAEDLRERFPARRGSIHFLPSGFEDVQITPELRDERFFRMVYAGRFSLSRTTGSPATFFAGLARALETDPSMRERFRLVLLGNFTDDERQLWRVPGLAGCVEELGHTPYDEAQRIAAGATMLLLTTPPGLRSIATRKLFDYLAVARPIFALAEANEAARIVAETQSGLCVPHDERAVAAGLLRVFSLWKAGSLDREIPCCGNGLYRAREHFARVFDDILRTLTSP